MNALQQANVMKNRLKAKLTQIAGVPLEITIRGEKNFTFSYDCINKAATTRLVNFFAGYSIEVDEDQECGTCIYVNA